MNILLLCAVSQREYRLLAPPFKTACVFAIKEFFSLPFFSFFSLVFSLTLPPFLLSFLLRAILLSPLFLLPLLSTNY